MRPANRIFTGQHVVWDEQPLPTPRVAQRSFQVKPFEPGRWCSRVYSAAACAGSQCRDLWTDASAAMKSSSASGRGHARGEESGACASSSTGRAAA